MGLESGLLTLNSVNTEPQAVRGKGLSLKLLIRQIRKPEAQME